MVKIGDCPICLMYVEPGEEIKEADLLTCPHCRSVLFIGSIQDGHVALEEAPLIEEDRVE